jgi:hypothetical protein
VASYMFKAVRALWANDRNVTFINGLLSDFLIKE